MLFDPPILGAREVEVLEQVEAMKVQLRNQLHEPRRWSGSLRRLSFARNIQGSNSIEGFDAKLDDAAAVALGEEPLDASIETQRALEGYRNAMTYVIQLAQESPIEFSEQLLKSLHFMMTHYDLKNRPGRWRQGAIYVRNDETGEIVYEGADVDAVGTLMGELVKQLGDQDGSPALIRASMAHLNLVMIHPFRDGNGRMARCLQSLVLAESKVLSPVFMSIEEYLGRNTQTYYNVLGEVGQGSWQPTRDALPWIHLMLTAHFRQARTLQRRIKESELMWYDLERIVNDRALPERTIYSLYEATIGLRVRRATYLAVALEDNDELTEQTASRDLKLLVDGGLLLPHGERRGRYYTGSHILSGIRMKIFEGRDPTDGSDLFVA